MVEDNEDAGEDDEEEPEEGKGVGARLRQNTLLLHLSRSKPVL